MHWRASTARHSLSTRSRPVVTCANWCRVSSGARAAGCPSAEVAGAGGKADNSGRFARKGNAMKQKICCFFLETRDGPLTSLNYFRNLIISTALWAMLSFWSSKSEIQASFTRQAHVLPAYDVQLALHFHPVWPF